MPTGTDISLENNYENGLHIEPNGDVHLGGTLVEDTEIDVDSNKYCIKHENTKATLLECFEDGQTNILPPLGGTLDGYSLIYQDLVGSHMVREFVGDIDIPFVFNSPNGYAKFVGDFPNEFSTILMKDNESYFSLSNVNHTMGLTLDSPNNKLVLDLQDNANDYRIRLTEEADPTTPTIEFVVTSATSVNNIAITYNDITTPIPSILDLTDPLDWPTIISEIQAISGGTVQISQTAPTEYEIIILDVPVLTSSFDSNIGSISGTVFNPNRRGILSYQTTATGHRADLSSVVVNANSVYMNRRYDQDNEYDLYMGLFDVGLGMSDSQKGLLWSMDRDGNHTWPYYPNTRNDGGPIANILHPDVDDQ